MAEVRDEDELFTLPAREFVPARNALAARLKKEGDRERAAAVLELRRPTRVAAALNQVVRAAPGEVRALLEASESLRVASRKAVSGAGADSLRRAQREERDAIVRLLARLPLSSGDLDAARRTLLALAHGPREAQERLAAGRLEHEESGEPDAAWSGPGLAVVKRGRAASAAERRERAAEKKETARRKRALALLKRNAKQIRAAERRALAARAALEEAQERADAAQRALERSRREGEELGAPPG